MDKILKNKKGRGTFILFVVIAILAFSFMLWNQESNIPVANAIGQQGDRYWTSSTSPYSSPGEGSYVAGPVFPRENNAQFVATYLQARGNADGTVAVYQKSATSDYATVTTADTGTAGFCGGSTTYVHVDSNDIVPAGGGIYVAIDSGAGEATWAYVDSSTGEVESGGATSATDVLALNSGISNASAGPTAGPYLGGDLSGTTFGTSSRVYPLVKVAEFVVNATTLTIDSSEGLFAGTKDSPVLFLADITGGGTSIFGITGVYK